VAEAEKTAEEAEEGILTDQHQLNQEEAVKNGDTPLKEDLKEEMTINNPSEMKNQTSTMKKDGQEGNPKNKYLRQLYKLPFFITQC